MSAQPNTEDLLPEYNFDYSKAKPNRFAKKKQLTSRLMKMLLKFLLILNR